MPIQGVKLGFLALLSIVMAVPFADATAQENPTNPGTIPDPSTYQGSMELQRQSDERDRQQREEQARQSQEQQQQYEQNQRQQQQRVSGNGSAAQQAVGGPHRGLPRGSIDYAAITRASEAYGRHEYAAALRIIRPLAARGDMFAQYLMAATYDRGKALPQNHPMALQWYRRSAAQGFAWSMYELGEMYQNGEVAGRPDFVQAYRWYTLSIAHLLPGGEDGEPFIPQLREDLAKLSAKMTGSQIGQAKALAREDSIPYREE